MRALVYLGPGRMELQKRPDVSPRAGEVSALLNENKLDVSSLIRKEIPLTEALGYFERLARDPGDLIKVVVSEA